jgi:predicted ATPase/DNA-binding CsgD family transcriptional regulator
MSQARHGANTQPARHTSLPIALTSFVGRERELADVARLLASARLISMVGPGGGGKTRLALRVATQIADQFADGVCWVELARLSDPALVLQAVAKALNVTEQPDVPLPQALLERVRAKHMLLVLDNCEHVLTTCAGLAEALLRGTGITIFATSREPLGIEGEMIYLAPSLALPVATLPVGEVGQYDAIRLFIERARGVRHDFALTPDNADAIIEICRRLDGIPLAIELASARVGVLSVQQIAVRLDSRLDLLVSPMRPDERHRTLRAAIDWSYDLLSPAEQRLLQRLSIFAAGFTLSTAESACAWGEIERADVLNLLASLVSKSLVAAETLQGSEARYRLLETIRQYAGEKLIASAARAEACDHFLDCYAQVADEIGPKLFGQFQQAWFVWVEAEHDNFRTALAWALERGQIEAGLRIATALCQFWLTRDSVREGFTWFERFLSQSDGSIPLAVHVNALTFGTFLASFLGDAPTATAWSGRAMALCEAGGAEGHALLGFALAGVDSAMEASGDFEAAYAVAEREIELDRHSGDPLLLGMALFTQGTRAVRLGKVEAARAYLDEAMAVAHRDGDPYRVAHVLNGMGDLARVDGRFAQAASLYEQSLAGFRDLGATRDIPNVERHLAYAVLRQGEIARAHALFSQSLEMLMARDNRAGMLRGLLGFAACAAAAGMIEASARLGEFVLGKRDPLKRSFDSGDAADEADYEQLTQSLRAQLGEAEFEAAQAEGRAFTIHQAVHYALDLRLSAPTPPQEANAPTHDLTVREREIVELIASGFSNGDIAGKLVLSKRTVEKHIANILSKLGLTNRAQVVRWAMDHGVTL